MSKTKSTAKPPTFSYRRVTEKPPADYTWDIVHEEKVIGTVICREDLPPQLPWEIVGKNGKGKRGGVGYLTRAAAGLALLGLEVPENKLVPLDGSKGSAKAKVEGTPESGPPKVGGRLTSNVTTALRRMTALLEIEPPVPAAKKGDMAVTVQGVKEPVTFVGKPAYLLAELIRHAKSPKKSGGFAMKKDKIQDAIRLTRTPARGLADWEETALLGVLTTVE